MKMWSKWKNIERIGDYEKFGVYKIRLINLNRSPVKIPRFLNKDKNGILLIGYSKNIKRRIKYFSGASKGIKYSHAEGQRMHLIKGLNNFEKRYNGFQVQYSFCKLPNEQKGKRKEGQLLKSYFKRYGEVPPLNRNLPKKYIRKP